MTFTLSEISEALYLDVADKILEKLESLEYTSEYCPPEDLNTVVAKLIKQTIIGNVNYNQSDSLQTQSEGTVDGWISDLQDQL